MAATTQPVQPSLRGYNLLAGVMAEHSDLAIHPRFLAAHYHDLMLQEAEIVCLLSGLGRTEASETPGSSQPQPFDTNFQDLIASKHTEHGERLWAKRMQLRKQLKEHADHLLQITSLIHLPKANEEDTIVLEDWLRHKEGGDGFPFTDREIPIWSRSPPKDLASLNGHTRSLDLLSRLFEGKVLTWLNNHGLHRLRSNHIIIYDRYLNLRTRTRLQVYSDATIRRLVAAVGTGLASLLPVMSMYVLYFVRRQLVRLGLVAVFNVLFAVVVMVITNARMSECFAAAAAFSAVLVVFVSGDNGVNSAA